MAPDAGVASRKSTVGRNGATSRLSLKKGPWTAAEDAILMEYVKKHGEGNWNAVQRNSGLMRCGKSCRLRWANHLRPNLKKGAFSSQEEALIVQLHAKLGNKWARMAAQLPGRTDNEIKNYWNTRLKRRQRAGLPIYTHDVNVKTQVYDQQENNYQANHLSSSSLGILLSSPPPAPPRLSPGYITPSSLFETFSTSSTTLKPRQQPKTSYLANSIQHLKYFEEKNGGLTLPPSSSGLFQFHNQEHQNSLTLPSIQYNCLKFGSDSRPISGVSFEQNGVVSRAGDVELPSIQSFVPKKTTPSSPTSMEYMIRMSSDDETNGGGFSRGNSGLLGDLIDESKSLTRAKKSKQDFLVVVDDQTQENYLWDYNLTQDKQIEDSASPPHSSIGVKTINSSSKESNSMDDDFLNLLDDFPLTNFRENQLESSNSVVATSVKTNGNFDVGSCYWKNMPRISQM